MTAAQTEAILTRCAIALVSTWEPLLGGLYAEMVVLQTRAWFDSMLRSLGLTTNRCSTSSRG